MLSLCAEGTIKAEGVDDNPIDDLESVLYAIFL